MANRNQCILFCKHCDFLKASPACVTEWLFLVLLQFCRAVPFSLFPNLVPSEIWQSLIDWSNEFYLWTSVSLLTLAAEAFPNYTARNLFAVGLMDPDFVCWAPHHKWGPVYVQPTLSYHEIKEHRSVQHVPGLQAVWDLVTDNAPYIGVGYNFALS